MDAYFLGAVSFISLLFLSGIIFIGAKKIQLPYTIALVGSGIILAILVKYIPALSFLTAFELSKDTLLYVFLPVLLFESAYNIRFREIIQHKWAIGLLAIVALVISAVLSAIGIYYILQLFWIQIPFLVLLLFGSLISATDPVSVLALFKEMWAPRRLTLLFEGESLFNDGTALALFLVIFGILLTQYPQIGVATHEHMSVFSQLMHSFHFSEIFNGFIAFILMIVMGFVVGGSVGYLTSQAIPFIRQSKLLEITLTVIIAHATFLLAEWINHAIVPVSAVITTTIAALVIGNYGRYKFSSETRHMMGEYWEFFAFIVNSLIFLLVGIMIVGLNIHFSEFIIPILTAIVVVAIARSISVYGVLLPLNATKIEYRIPLSWMHLLSWGSLRGGLSIIMVLFVPETLKIGDLLVRDFLLWLTVGCIVFTTFIKATTISSVMKKLHITDPSDTENMDFQQGRVLYLLKLRSKIHELTQKSHLSSDQKEILSHKFEKELEIAKKDFVKFSEKSPEQAEEILSKTLALHALEIEKSILWEIFEHNKIPETLLRKMLAKYERQIERIEDGKSQLKESYEKKYHKSSNETDINRYYKARTRSIILEQVLNRFEIFHSFPEVSHSSALKKIESLYRELLKKAQNERDELYKKSHIKEIEKSILDSVIARHSHDILEKLTKSGIINAKTAKKIEFDNE